MCRLIARPDASYVDAAGNTVLHHACMWADERLCRQLIRLGAETDVENDAGEPIEMLGVFVHNSLLNDWIGREKREVGSEIVAWSHGEALASRIRCYRLQLDFKEKIYPFLLRLTFKRPVQLGPARRFCERIGSCEVVALCEAADTERDYRGEQSILRVFCLYDCGEHAVKALKRLGRHAEVEPSDPSVCFLPPSPPRAPRPIKGNALAARSLNYD